MNENSSALKYLYRLNSWQWWYISNSDAGCVIL